MRALMLRNHLGNRFASRWRVADRHLQPEQVGWGESNAGTRPRSALQEESDVDQQIG